MIDETAIKRTKDLLILALRQFFKNKEHYSNITNQDYSNIKIYDKLPEELVDWPSLLISADNCNFTPSGLSDIAQDIINDEGQVIAYRYSGMLESTITLETATLSSGQREDLSDLVMITLRVLLRRKLEAKGLLLKNDMKYVSESEIDYAGKKIYISSIQFSTWAEWFRDINLIDLNDINLNDIDLNI